MKLKDDIYQTRIDFSVTEQVQRYVYVYLIAGRRCWLVDSGVCGSEGKIFAFMEKIGRKPEELAAIFLTHGHPDHMGAAAAMREQTDCRIYASERERPWIENVDLQYEQRPIPNFYRLARKSVSVDRCLKGGEQLLFTGDGIPEEKELPIFVDWHASVDSLDKIAALEPDMICPAWERVLEKGEIGETLIKRKSILEQLRQIVLELERSAEIFTEQDYIKAVAKRLGFAGQGENPLFRTSVQAVRRLI